MKSPNSMRFLKFGVSAILLAAFLFVGNTHGLVGARIPAFARLLNPFTGAWQQAVPATQEASELIIPAGINGDAVMDERGIPHVFADDLPSAIFIQGYLHARDRLFQMEISVRATEGRLAEVLGEGLIERDKTQRRKGMKIAAQRTTEGWLKNEETAAVVRAYTNGVNAYLDQLQPADYPVEYKLLGFEPERWSVYKSAVFSKSMAETLCFRNRDMATTNIRTALGDSLFAHIYPQYNPKQSPVVAEEPWLAESSEMMPAEEQLTEIFPFPELPQSPEGIGSNNWALAGSKTATGAPLLSNDPHLSLTLPSIWYEMHIVAGDYNVYGVSLPSLPSILIGFNGQTAWGITNVGQDVLDWYRIEWADDQQKTYLLDGEATPVEEVMDTIVVRGQEPVIVRTPWTIFGPVVYDQPENEYYNLAMRWVAHDAPFHEDSDNVKAFIDLARASTLDGYIEALKPFDSPGSNIVYANQDNDIALTVTGHFPIRADQQGRFVQDGTTRANAWQGFIPYEEIPRDINPERQHVASANQRSAALSYPYYYIGSFDDYRGRYINRRLAELSNAKPEDMMALQWDSYSLKAEEALPAMLALLDESALSAEEKEGISILKEWDFRYTATTKGPVIFNSWIDSLYQLTFDEVYGLWEEDVTVLFPENWRFIELMANPTDTIFDRQATPEIETATDLALMAYQQAAAAAMPLVAEGKDWSTHRSTSIRHLASIPGFDSGPLTTDGARDTPNALSSSFGPSWRMIVSLEKPLKAWGVLPGGSSGNAGSPYYTEGVAEWSKGEYFELKRYGKAEEVPGKLHLKFE